MSKNITIKVNGFNIYLGISKNEKKANQNVSRAYQNQLHRKAQERSSFKQEYDLARLF